MDLVAAADVVAIEIPLTFGPLRCLKGLGLVSVAAVNPSGTIDNVFASSQLSDDLVLTVHIDNVFDDKHYVSSCHKWWATHASPRSYTVGVKYAL